MRQLLLALGLLAIVGCRSPERVNVLLVVADTLRADRLSAYGYARPTSPNLERLAADGVLFEHAWAQASSTFPSMNSLLTSRHPALFFGQPKGALGIPPHIPQLAELLHREGYATAAVSASPIVRHRPGQVNKVGGFGGGFDTFEEACEWRWGRCVSAAALRLLPQLREPFFLYAHYLDPHAVYTPPRPLARRFAAAQRGTHAWSRAGDPRPISAALYGDAETAWDERDVQQLSALYDGEVAAFDRELGRLLAALAERGLAERTLVIVAADHGEALLEHGHAEHGHSLFEEELHVPLVLRPPGGGSRRVATAVANLDIVPTILDYLGLAGPPGIEGRSLRPLAEGHGEGREARPLFALIGDLRATTDGRHKLIRHLGNGEVQLFDLRADAGERRDLWPARTDAARPLAMALTAWVEREGPAARDRSSEAIDQLRALGYMR